MRALGVRFCLIADSLEPIDAILERRIVQIDHARLDGVIDPLEAQFRFRCPLVQLGDMFLAALGAFFPAVEDGCKDGFQPFGLQQSAFQVIGHQII
ncbi:hypothetical protein [Paracoccus alkanivorans]|uniref:hypothetical protein n=1 Tax=Paracoccus alkanivorans TaxID=2116655 RepID=UPI001FB6DE58|nr:hypothetical protein [Paracoccus alkanivorans]